MNLHQRSPGLTECDREAIHHIAAVQSFGGLIAVDPEGRIAHVSANVADLLGLPALPEVGTPVAEIIAELVAEAEAALARRDRTGDKAA